MRANSPAATSMLRPEPKYSPWRTARVLRGPYLFYDVVYALEVQHPSGIVRYGEIARAAEGIAAGITVKAGQVIGYVGKMKTVAQSMLHLEVYAGTAQGS